MIQVDIFLIGSLKEIIQSMVEWIAGLGIILVLIQVVGRMVGRYFFLRLKVTFLSVWNGFLLWWRKKIRVGLFKCNKERVLRNIQSRENYENGVFLYFSPIDRLNDIGIDPMFVKIQNNTSVDVRCEIKLHGESLKSVEIGPQVAYGEIVSPYDLVKFVNKELKAELSVDNSRFPFFHLVSFKQQPRMTIDRILDKNNYIFTSKKHCATNKKNKWVVYSCLRKVFGTGSEIQHIDSNSADSGLNEGMMNNISSEDNAIDHINEGKGKKTTYVDLHPSVIYQNNGIKNNNKNQIDIFKDKLNELLKDNKFDKAVFVFSVDQKGCTDSVKKVLDEKNLAIANYNSNFGFHPLGLCSIEVNLK